MNSLTSISSRTLAITLRRTFLRISLAFVSQQELNATYLIDYLRVQVSVSANLEQILRHPPKLKGYYYKGSLPTSYFLMRGPIELWPGFSVHYLIFFLFFGSIVFFSSSLIKVKLTKVNFTTCTPINTKFKLEKCRINSTTKNLARDLD